MTEAVDAGAGAPATGVGAELARAREALGLSLADVAQQLKFAPRQIEALEADRFEALPPGTFARGMVRAYARLLKLDADALVARAAGSVPVPDNAAAVVAAQRPIPITDSARRSNLVYAALSLALLAVAVAVVWEWGREDAGAARLTFVPAAQAPLEPGSGAPVGVVASAAPGAAAPFAAEAEVPAAPAKPAAAATTAAATTATAKLAAAGAARRLVLTFERESWVQVRGRGGRLLTSELNRAGTERVVEGEPPFDLVIGNAQHVRLTYDDQPVDLAPHIKVEVARFTLE